MSDILGALEPGNDTGGDSGSNLDLSAGAPGWDLPPGFTFPGLTNASGAPVLTLPQSVTPAGGNPLDALSRLVATVYQGEASNAYAKGDVRAQQTDAASRRTVAQAAPTNLFLIGAVLVGGFVLAKELGRK